MAGIKVLKVPEERAAELAKLRRQLDDAKKEFGELADKTRQEVGKDHVRFAHRGEFDEGFNFMVVKAEEA